MYIIEKKVEVEKKKDEEKKRMKKRDYYKGCIEVKPALLAPAL